MGDHHAGFFPADATLLLVPTGAGENRQLTGDAINHLDARFFPDGKRILFLGSEPGHGARLFVQDLGGGAARPVTPEGVVRRSAPDCTCRQTVRGTL